MSLTILLLIGIFTSQTVARRNDRNSLDVYKQCTVITEPICQSVRYTHTRMPNLIGIYSTNEASKRIRDYYPLINVQCSYYFKLYLCSIYFPICDSEAAPSTPIVKPCRRLCLHVKQRCEPFMKDTYQLSWPNELECDNLPNTGKFCLAPDNFEMDKETKIEPNHSDQMKKLFQQLESMMKRSDNNVSRIEILRKAGYYASSKCLPSHLNIGQMPNVSCAQRCDADIKFNEGDKAFANVWLIGWSLLCMISSFFTIVTFSCNTNRFMYPEKPIVFLSICYFFYSCGNLLGAILGRRNVICRPFNEQLDFLVGNGNETTWCKIIFLMLYFFSSASALWWVVLTITWFLSASRHWGYEAIESISSVLHLISWGIPALKSIFVLILHKIDADELSGQCFVGNEDKEALVGFVIIPQIIYLITGMTFLGMGYFSILKVRRSFLEQPTCIDTNNLKRLEKLMAKIGVFSILYIVPVTCTIASYAIDAFKTTYFDLTLKALFEYSSECVTSKGLSWSLVKCVHIIRPALPSVEMRMLRIFMNLVVGITSGIWIWGNKKTIRYCFCFLSNQKNEKEVQLSEMKQNEALNPLNNPSYFKQGDYNSQYPQWNYTPMYVLGPMSSGSIPVSIEGPAAPNNSSVSEPSSKH